MPAWWQYPITQAHGENGEQGVDFGVPFHTPLTPILPGQVQRIDCSSGWRCEIDILTSYQGQQAIESFLHVDQPMVSVGEQVNTGTVLGLSGGQLSGGSNPDSSQFSTGPHTEFDIFMGNKPWQNAIDPTSLARGGPQAGSGGNGLIGGLTGGVANNAGNVVSDVSQGFGALANALDPAKALGSLSSAITGNPNIHDFLLRALLVVGGLFLLGLAVVVLVEQGTQQAANSPAGQTALKSVGTVGAAAAA